MNQCQLVANSDALGWATGGAKETCWKQWCLRSRWKVLVEEEWQMPDASGWWRFLVLWWSHIISRRENGEIDAKICRVRQRVLRTIRLLHRQRWIHSTTRLKTNLFSRSFPDIVPV